MFMGFLRLVVASALVLAGLVSAGCAKKKTRGVTFEGPESEVTFEMETTDKTPDDEDDE